MSDELLGRGQAARYSGVLEITIDRWVRSGHLKCVVVGSVRKYRRADLDGIFRQETEATAEVEAK